MSFDAAAKAIFSDPVVMASLLREFIDLPCVREFDVSTLELEPANYASPAFLKRENDLVWKIKLNSTWCFLYIMLEFQRAEDRWMALRINAYTALLLQQVVKNEKSLSTLPPVFPIVIYNGEKPWKATTDVRGLFPQSLPQDLDKFQPKQAYYLLDTRRIGKKRLMASSDAAGYVFRVEQAANPNELAGVIRDLIRELSGPGYHNFRECLGNYIKCHMQRNNWQEKLDVDFPEGDMAMWAENLDRYLEEERNASRLEGIAAGRREGIAAGRREGKEEALKESLSLQISSLAKLLARRFGPLPESWRDRLAKLESTEQIMELCSLVYQADSLQAYEKQLIAAQRQ